MTPPSPEWPNRCGWTRRHSGSWTGGRTSSWASSRTSCGILWRRCGTRSKCCALVQDSPSASAKARQILERQIAHMVRIVDDLLDVSRITLGKVELRKEHLQLKNIVESAVELSRPGDRRRPPRVDRLTA